MMRIALFGATTVWGPVARVDAKELGGAKPRQLLQMLALELGTAVPKERLAERLWNGRPPASYISTLESYVCLLRRRLSAAGMERGTLVTTGCGYLLDPGQVEVDVAEARGMLAASRAGATDRSRGPDLARDVAHVLDLVTGELLADEPYAMWAIEEREAFTALLSDACVAGARQANRAGRSDLALRLSKAAVSHRFASETATEELMRALWRTGHRTEALQTYAGLRETLLDEFGLEPGPASRRLYLAVLRSGAMLNPRDGDQRELGTLLRLVTQVLQDTSLGREPVALRLVEATRELSALAV